MPFEHISGDSTPKIKTKRKLAAPMPSQDELLRKFSYCKVSGGLFHKDGRRADAGKSNGYNCVTYRGYTYLSHRIIWKMVTGGAPKRFIDHKNRDRADNRFENLRDVSQGINLRNLPIRENTKNPYPGVCFRQDPRVWYASINVSRQNLWLGSFESFEDALSARLAAEKKHGFISPIPDGHEDWISVRARAASLMRVKNT